MQLGGPGSSLVEFGEQGRLAVGEWRHLLQYRGLQGGQSLIGGLHGNTMQNNKVHVLMRDEKEGIKKQARSNKQQGKATQHTRGSHFS